MDGQQVKQLRQKFGLSQDGLARKLGISRQTVYKWEKGENRPSPLAIERLKMVEAELLKVGTK